jgi:hypothetical protein
MKTENYPNYKLYTLAASTKNSIMKNEPVLTVSEILNEISAIEKKIQYLENIKVCEIMIWYNQKEDREFLPLSQSKISFSFTVEVQKLISDSIKYNNTKLLNLFQLLNQQK